MDQDVRIRIEKLEERCKTIALVLETLITWLQENKEEPLSFDDDQKLVGMLKEQK